MVLVFFTEPKRFSEQLCPFGRLSDAGFSIGFFAMCERGKHPQRYGDVVASAEPQAFIAVEVVRVDGNFLPCWPPQRARTTAYSPPASATVLFDVKTDSGAAVACWIARQHLLEGSCSAGGARAWQPSDGPFGVRMSDAARSEPQVDCRQPPLELQPKTCRWVAARQRTGVMRRR